MLDTSVTQPTCEEPVSRFDTPGNPPLSYTVTARVLHWSIAFAVGATFAYGWWMQTIPKGPSGLRADAFNLHKSIGLTLAGLMVVRLIWRALHPPPPLASLQAWQRNAARANHAILYCVLFAIPLAGYLGSAFSGYPMKYFGLSLPLWAGKSMPLKTFCSTVHLWTSWILLVAVVVHVGAAIRHAVIDRDG